MAVHPRGPEGEACRETLTPSRALAAWVPAGTGCQEGGVPGVPLEGGCDRCAHQGCVPARAVPRPAPFAVARERLLAAHAAPPCPPCPPTAPVLPARLPSPSQCSWACTRSPRSRRMPSSACPAAQPMRPARKPGLPTGRPANGPLGGASDWPIRTHYLAQRVHEHSARTLGVGASATELAPRLTHPPTSHHLP